MYEACVLVIACHSRSDCGTVQRDVNRKNTEGGVGSEHSLLSPSPSPYFFPLADFAQ